MRTPKKLRNWVRKRLGKKYIRMLMRSFKMSPKTASFHLAHVANRKEMAGDYPSEDFTPEGTRVCGTDPRRVYVDAPKSGRKY